MARYRKVSFVTALFLFSICGLSVRDGAHVTLVAMAQSAGAQTPQPAATAQPTATPQPAATTQPGGMDPFRKDLIDAASKIGGVIGVFVAIFVAYTQVRKNREERQQHDKQETAQQTKELAEATISRQQRQEELRWRKAGLAKDVLNKLWDDALISDAMLMLDRSNREYLIKEGVTSNITGKEVWAALRTEPVNYTETEKYVRECFIKLFGTMQEIEHYLSIGLIEFADIDYPFRHLVSKLEVNHDVVHAFLTTYGYDKAESFMERFKKPVN